jgi:ferredoxin
MLRKLRIILSLFIFIAITLMVLDFTGILHGYFSWIAKIQLLPAILAVNFIVVVALLVITLIMGRIYCSVICPLGIYQDVVAWLSRKLFQHGRAKYHHIEHPLIHNVIRGSLLALFIILMVCGMLGVASLIAPYSSFVRMTQTLLQPLYIMANNVLAGIAEEVDSYAFYEVDVWMRSGAVFAITLVTWLIISFMAARWGRLYCNSICPVGSVLGVLSRFSWLKPRVKADKCIHCGLCERGCKAQAIKVTREGTTIDYTRCVDCFDCLDVCKHGALEFREPSSRLGGLQNTQEETAANNSSLFTLHSSLSSRRSFLLTALSAGAGAALAQTGKKVDGGYAVIKDKVIPERQTPILPPGARSAHFFAQHCTACQLCVSECPNDVLRPSTDLMHFMQPVMSYERGYCREECHRCSEVCPTGALKLVDAAEKISTKIGQAHWVKKNCIPLTDGVECGNCARHCPTGAIEMIPLDEDDDETPWIPMVNEARCIGCGACENLCPARPLSAIIVEGIEEQHKI